MIDNSGTTSLHSKYCMMQVIHERNKFDANPSAQQKDDASYAWVKDLQPEDVDFLLNQPYTVNVPPYNSIVVHAGLVPGVALNCQRPLDMVTMRGLFKESDGSYSGTSIKAADPWAPSWPGPEHVYYGHAAIRGLEQHKFATGLDTGCVYGRQLTGAIISSPGQQPVLCSVPAQQVYSVPR